MAAAKSDLSISGRTDFLKQICKLPNSVIPEKVKNNLRFLNLETGLKQVDDTKICKFCSTEWDGQNCRIEVRPTPRPTKAMQRILAKCNAGKKLSVIEKKLASRISNTNTKVITCVLCGKETKINLKKPLTNNAKTVSPVEPEFVLPLKKKRRKKTLPLTPNNNSKFIVLDSTDDSKSQITVLENLMRSNKRKRKRKTSAPNTPSSVEPDYFTIDCTASTSRDNVESPDVSGSQSSLEPAEITVLEVVKNPKKINVSKITPGHGRNFNPGSLRVNNSKKLFQPLEASTPLVGKNFIGTPGSSPLSGMSKSQKKSKRNLEMPTPISNRPSATSVDKKRKSPGQNNNSHSAKKKRLSSLQKLLDDPPPRKSQGPNLKDFLSLI